MTVKSSGIRLKKKFGQHFLRDHGVVQRMLQQVDLSETSSIFEVGCGDGFLTKEIVRHPFERLWIFEIDPEWAELVGKEVPDARISIFRDNILDVDFNQFKEHAPWTLLSNLPYQIVFPFLYLLKKNRHFLREGVIMVQEEVAQKVVKTSGRGYGFPSLYFQHFFDWKLLEKIPPGAFHPPPKVVSRLLHFTPRAKLDVIPDEEEFWPFVKLVFRQPRRTVKNNLSQGHYNIDDVPESVARLRAQQMSKQDLLQLWDLVRNKD